MCGIFALLNNDNTDEDINKSFMLGVNRGPEFSHITKINNIHFGFHRLAINGLNSKSNQPFDIKDCILICNGEIYNFKELSKNNQIEMTTDSDCEIIIHMYKLYGIEYTLNQLDGVFAFILYDKNIDTIYVARDPYGVRPLYYFEDNKNYGFSSELKSIYKLTNSKNKIKTFTPGHYLTIVNNEHTFIKYTGLPFTNNIYNDESTDSLNVLNKTIVEKITNAVKKRVVGTTERPIACLLSGGLDSSLIAALVSRQLNNCENTSNKLKTFSIGLPNSEDLKYAKIVAKHINSEHHEIILTEDQFFDSIPEVINKIESYDTTTVRASVGNYLVAKYISNNTDCKVIFNGDGADELMGGYLYFKNAPNQYDFDKECRRLLKDIHTFDVLRSDKSISSNGLEPRTPFLDREWVEFYLSIDKNYRYKTTVENSEKFIIRNAFSEIEPELLPKEILWRTKEAFSDGVSSLTKSWYEIINEKITDKYSQNKELQEQLDIIRNNYKEFINFNNPITLEQCYYRYLFNNDYYNCDYLIPYYWMPKFIDANDASARTLKIYSDNNSNKIINETNSITSDIENITMF